MSPTRHLLLCTTVLLLGLAALPASDVPLQEQLDQRREVASLLQASYVFVGGGSGVVVSPDGAILTNHHVAGGAEEWRIRFQDGRSYMADHIASDPIGDITLLKIRAEEGETFTHVQLASAEDLVAGRPVLAIGNPFSLGDVDNTPTVTAGTLGTGRIVRGNYSDCVQLDAPVNPGNSGGPLLDEHGRLLGINGQIRTRTGMRINSGIGLAIACTQLAAFLPVMQSCRTGYVHHTAIPEGLRLEQTDDGVRVRSWSSRLEDEADLLQEGDLLLRIAGRAVTSLPTAMGLFASLPWTGPDTRIAVELLRDGERHEMQLTTGRTRIAPKASTGMRFVRRTRYHDDGSEYHVMLVGSVADGSPAAEAGVQTGWRVQEADGVAIDSRLDLLKVLAPLDIGDELDLLLIDEDSGAEHRTTVALLPFG